MKNSKAILLSTLTILVLSVTIGGCKKDGTCSDGIKNQDETQVDCGGVCSICNSNNSGTCSDGIQNQNETGVDCGGVCSACNNNNTGTCSDGIQNQNETGIDCGGVCSACSSGSKTLTVNTQSLSFDNTSGSNTIVVESNI